MQNAQPTGEIVFVDRDNELKTLKDAYDEVVKSQKSKFVLIEGDLGSGKTALVHKFLKSLEESDSVIGEGECALEMQMNGLQPFSQLLFSLTSNQEIQITLKSTAEFIKQVAPAWIDILTRGAATATAKAVVDTLTSGQMFVKEHKLSQDNLFLEYRKALEEIAKKHTVVGFIDAFQWADKSSIGLLGYLAQTLLASPILMIIAYRPVEAKETEETAKLFGNVLSNSQARERITLIDLRLGLDTLLYINKRYPKNKFSEEFVLQIKQYTEGNPLLLEQFCKYAEGKGAIFLPTNGETVWTINNDLLNTLFAQARENVIKTIGAVLKERYRLLQGTKDNDLYETLSYASVEGEYFSVQVIAAVRGVDEESVFNCLNRLAEQYQMVIPVPDNSLNYTGKSLDTYRFNPLILRDIVYKMFPTAQQRSRHKKVANYLENITDTGNVASRLATQFKDAKDYLSAAKYALAAAKFEQSQSKISESEDWCNFGLELLTDLREGDEEAKLGIRLRKTIADGYFNSGKYGIAGPKYDELLAETSIDNPQDVAEIYARIAHSYILAEEELERARECCLEGKELLKLHHIPFGEFYLALDVNHIKCNVTLTKSDKVLLLEKAIEYGGILPEEKPMLDSLALAHKWLGVELQDLGRYEAAKASYVEALKVSRKCENKDLESQCLLNLADLANETGDYTSGREYAQDGQSLSSKIGELDNMAYAQAMEGYVNVQQENYPEGIKNLCRAIEVSQEIKSAWNMPYMLSDLAIAYLGKNDSGDYQKAVETIQTIDLLAIEDRVKRGYLLLHIGRIYSTQELTAAIRKHFADAIECFAEHRHFRARAQYYFAEAILTNQPFEVDIVEAIGLLQEAIKVFSNLSLQLEEERANMLLSSARKSP